jgi:hypothetical protein
LQAWIAGGHFGVAALDDRAHGVAGLGGVGQVDPGLVLDRRPLGAAAATAAVLEVGANPVGLIGFDGTGVGLSGHADGFKRIEDGPALYFQFARQIVDSNFGHPSLLCCRLPLLRFAA